MENGFLFCNAHLDPVWLWTWDEGAAEAVSTFRTAAQFCDEYDGFVFNHNEAILYEWIEEYEPELFERIKKHVESGKWQIVGGWYLQPDCTMLSGESFIRQIEYGRKYFAEKFGKTTKTAMNVDSFGHTRGLVQILKKTGFENYIFIRPHHLKSGNYIWKGFDGSEILAHRMIKGYKTLKGQALSSIISTIEQNKEKENLLLPWGIGDHGGGPSRVDLEDFKEYMQNGEYNLKHSNCEEYFSSVDRKNLEIFGDSFVHCMVGCYSTMVRIKQLNRRIENKIEMYKRMSYHAGISVDKSLEEYCEKNLMLGQFHDVIPGTSIKNAETDALNFLGAAEDICNKNILKAFFKLSEGQEKCKDGEIPILVYNPMPYNITTEIEIEFQLEDQNWTENEFTIARVYDKNGNFIPTQNERENSTIELDWRKKIVFVADLEPASMNRFNCQLETKKNYNRIAEHKNQDNKTITFENERRVFVINKKTGLIDKYEVDGKALLNKGSAVINSYFDNEDPWGMEVSAFPNKERSFKLMSAKQANKFRGYPKEKTGNVSIIENGDVRTKVQAIFKNNNSIAVVTYTVPKNNVYVDIDVTMFSNDVNRLYKLSFDSCLKNSKFMGQTAFGTEELIKEGKEVSFHQWCGLVGEENSLYIINNGTYAGSAEDNMLNMTLLRTPIYSAHPITNRQAAPKDRYTNHIDMGERQFKFRLTNSPNIDFEAEKVNMPPYAVTFFPSGKGESKGNLVEINNKNILLSTLGEKDGKVIVRLYNSTDDAQNTELIIKNNKNNISFEKFEVKTFVIEGEQLAETDMLGNKL